MTQSNSGFVKVINTKPPNDAYKQASNSRVRTKEQPWTRVDKRSQEASNV